MNLKTRMLGGALSFAHLAGIGKPSAKAKGKKAEDDEEDKPAAEEGDEDNEDDPPKGKKAKADDDQDEDDKPAAEEGDEDDEDDPPKGKKAKADDDDGDEPDADDDEDDPPKGKKAKAASADYRRGRAHERQRCAKIFGAQAAAKNLPLAASLAFSTDLSSSEAIKVLKATPGAASAGRDRRNPDLGSDPHSSEAATGQSGSSWKSAFAKVGAGAGGNGGWGKAFDKAAR